MAKNTWGQKNQSFSSQLLTTLPAFYDKYRKHRSNLSQIPHFSPQNHCFLPFFVLFPLGKGLKHAIWMASLPSGLHERTINFVAQMLVHFVDYI
ncbi:MAG: hypothetical protein J6S65_07280 [Bacteroidaceae bacterium]|nr:hypothetical protein [Bacteroidaceae bacterium]